MNIPIERRAEAARIYEEFLDGFNTALLDLPETRPITRSFAVYIATTFDYERGFEIKDMELAKQVFRVIGALETRIVALEERLEAK